MKKSFSLFIIMTLLFSMSFNIFAATENNSYTIEELKLNITAPENWITFTRDIPNTDENIENLEYFQIDKNKLLDFYKENNIYFNTMDINGNYEIVVTMVESDGSKELFNFNEYSDDRLEKTTTAKIDDEDVKNNGITYSENHFIYSNNNIKYIVLDFTKEVDEKIIYGRQYYTIYNGQAINISSYSYDGEMPKEILNIQKEVIDTVEFTETLSHPDSKVSTKSIVVTVGIVVIGMLFIIFKIKNRKSKK